MFRLFLDETMTYSCAIWESPEMTLREAQEAKLERVCRKLELTPDDHVVEIGTGWGSFALHSAGRYGYRVTTTTISKQQNALAAERVRDAGAKAASWRAASGTCRSSSRSRCTRGAPRTVRAERAITA